MTLIPGTNTELIIVDDLYKKHTFIPCPFCGADRFSICKEGDVHFVECINCGAQGPDRVELQAAVKAWNERFPKIGLIDRLIYKFFKKKRESL